MKSRQLAEIWDGESHKYTNNPLDSWPFESSWLPKADETVLDAGCGGGTFLKIFSQFTSKCQGIDISEKMVEASQRYAPADLGSVVDLPYPSGKFDYVFSGLVLSHCGAPWKGLSELSRVCREGGRVVVTLPNRYSFLSALRNISLWTGNYGLGQCYHFRPGQMKARAEDFGLNASHIEIWNRAPENRNSFRQGVSFLAYGADELLHRIAPQIWGDVLMVGFHKVG